MKRFCHLQLNAFNGLWLPAIFFLLVSLFLSTPAVAEEEPLTEQLVSAVQHDAFRLNAIFQAGLNYSFDDDNFHGGRSFEAANARLSIRGLLDGRFFYRVHVNMVREPNLLDLFIGYQHSDAFRLTAGAQKPRQSADFIPNPGETDFARRARITGQLVQSREIGVSADGNIGEIYYYAGLFNGSRLQNNTNNKFYGIGRLQYTLEAQVPGTLQLAVHGSHGESEGVRSGNAGPMLDGERTILGADLRWEADPFLLAAEYMTGDLETQMMPDVTETISGFYLTGGYWIRDNTILSGRYQSWGYEEADWRDNQLTVGVLHLFTTVTSLMLNFDAYLPDEGDHMYGASVYLQVMF